jgi:hypothetical protein
VFAVSWRTDAHGAADRDILAGAACAEAAAGLLDTWRSTNEFLAAASGADDVVVLRSPTHDIGVWVIVRITDGRVDSLLRVSADRESVAVLGEGCRIGSSERPKALAADTSGLLTDDQVNAILAGGPAGVFYAWSPHMPLSVDGLNEILAAGQRLDIPVTLVLSRHANSRYARDRASGLQLPDGAFRISHSIELEMRDFNVHAPAILVYDNGRFVSPVIPGFRYAADYEALIVRFLDAARR